MACCALLQMLRGALLLALRYFSDMLHLPALYDAAFGLFMSALVERDVVPDALLRRGVRFLLRKRIADVRRTRARVRGACAARTTLGPGSVWTPGRPSRRTHLLTHHNFHPSTVNRCPRAWRSAWPTRGASWRS